MPPTRPADRRLPAALTPPGETPPARSCLRITPGQILGHRNPVLAPCQALSAASYNSEGGPPADMDFRGYPITPLPMGEGGDVPDPDSTWAHDSLSNDTWRAT